MTLFLRRAEFFAEARAEAHAHKGSVPFDGGGALESSSGGSQMPSLVVASILFSLSFGLIKAEVAGLDPLLVALIRLAFSFLLFAPLMRRTAPRVALRLAFIGFIQFGVMYCLYIASYRHLAGHQIALLTTATPIYVVLVDGLFDGPIARRSLISGGLAIVAGLVLVMSRAALTISLVSFAMVQAANVCFALGQVLYRRARPSGLVGSDAHAFGWLYLGALVAPIAASTLFEGAFATVGGIPSTLRQWLSLAYLGLVPSGIGFFLWNRGVARVSATVAAVANNLKVPLGVLLAWLLFGESLIAWRVLLSGSLLAIALLVAPRSSRAHG